MCRFKKTRFIVILVTFLFAACSKNHQEHSNTPNLVGLENDQDLSADFWTGSGDQCDKNFIHKKYKSTQSVVEWKTHFKETPFRHSEPNWVFNFAGAHTGAGDVSGPLFIALELLEIHKKRNQSVSAVAIIDDCAHAILKKMFGFTELEKLNQKLGIEFISPSQAQKIKKTDVILELFSAGRVIVPSVQKNHPFFGPKTLLVMSDNMHRCDKDSIEQKADEQKTGIRFYFNPPGIGPNRSGIVNNPEVAQFRGKTKKELRAEGALFFKDDLLRKIILGEHFKDAQLSFLYGVHNTLLPNYPLLHPQTTQYLKEVKRINSPESPLIVFSPEKESTLKEAVGNDFHVYSVEELDQITHLKNEVYLLPTGELTNSQFTYLIAISDVPLIVEGNSAISTALRLDQPFVVFRSTWNTPQIKDLINLEKSLHSSLFETVYGDHLTSDKDVPKTPQFEPLLENVGKTEPLFLEPSALNTPQRQANLLYENLNRHTQTFSDRLDFYLNLIHRIEENDQISDLGARESSYESLYEDIQSHWSDVTLEYSILKNARERGKISAKFLSTLESKIYERTLDVSRNEAQKNKSKDDFFKSIQHQLHPKPKVWNLPEDLSCWN